MSRIGRKPIDVPSGVDVKINGNHIVVKGPKGTLERDFHKDMLVALDGSVINVNRPSEDKEHKSLHGLTRTLIANMVEGVTSGFTKELEINGIRLIAIGLARLFRHFNAAERHKCSL